MFRWELPHFGCKHLQFARPKVVQKNRGRVESLAAPVFRHQRCMKKFGVTITKYQMKQAAIIW